MSFFPTTNPYFTTVFFSDFAEGRVMIYDTDTQGSEARSTPNEVWQFRVMFGAIFAVMLVPTVLARLSPLHWGENHSAEMNRSIFHETMARTDRIVPFMFMG